MSNNYKKWFLLYKKHEEIINYLIIGGFTTLISLIVKYGLLFTILDSKNAFELQIAVIVSWIISVLFAYVTNRLFVFKSKDNSIINEAFKFFGSRIATLLLDAFIMWFFVTLLKFNSNVQVIIITLISQVLVIVGNYILSKFFVFNKTNNKELINFNIIKKIIVILFIGIFLYIYSINIYVKNLSFYSLIILILLVLGCYLIYKKFNIIINNRILKYFIFSLLFIFIFIVAYYSKVTLTWDYGDVLTYSYNFIKNNEREIVYFAMYPNNLPIYLTISFIGKIIVLIWPNMTIKMLVNASIIVSSFFVFSSIVILLYLAKNKDIKYKNIILYSLLLYPPYILYSSIYYSDTFGIFLIMISLLLFFLMSKNTGKKKNILFILMLISMVLGFKIKATNIFIYFAILVIWFLDKDYKKILYTIPLFVVFLLSFNFILGKVYYISNEDYETYKFPYIHWVNMSLDPRQNGGYSSEDVNYMKSINSYSMKNSESIRSIKERVNHYGVNGLLKRIFYTKVKRTWTNTNVYSSDYLGRGPVFNTLVQKTILEDGIYYKYYSVFINAMWLFLIIGSFFSGIFNYKELNNNILISQICLIGIFIFLLIWECNGRYLYTFLPFLIICSSYGYYNLFKTFVKR